MHVLRVCFSIGQRPFLSALIIGSHHCLSIFSSFGTTQVILFTSMMMLQAKQVQAQEYTNWVCVIGFSYCSISYLWCRIFHFLDYPTSGGCVVTIFTCALTIVEKLVLDRPTSLYDGYHWLASPINYQIYTDINIVIVSAGHWQTQW